MNSRRFLCSLIGLTLISLLLLSTGSIFAAEKIIPLLDNLPDNSPGVLLSAEVIMTDTTEYAPGDSVVITGSGFWPSETVSVGITNYYNPGFADEAEPWDITADEYGNIETFWIVPPDGVDQTYLVTAEGLTSGIFVSTTFIDGNTILVLTVLPFDTTCVNSEIDVCGYLAQNCGHHNYAPLPNRPILFFINTGNCGNNVGIVSDDTVWTDENGLACATLTMPSIPGDYTIRIKFVGEDKPGYSDPPNSACNPACKTKLSASNECEGFTLVPQNSGNNPGVSLSDTTINSCSVDTVCIPVVIGDNECDIDTVYSNIGNYSTTISNYDQIQRYTMLGATILQVGGGAPGITLTQASDFVPPVNTHSGVSVTLPNFIFASSVSDYGSFPSGIGPAQSADQLKGSPTDLTFTLPGSGGPDGGYGDGSVDFSTGDHVALEFSQVVTVCDGSGSDFIVFTNSNSNGTAKFLFKNNGYPVHVRHESVPGSSAGTGIGGLILDIQDGVEFDEVEITCETGSIEVDAIAARVTPSSSVADLCFVPDTAGVYTLIVSAEDKCFNTGADTAYITIQNGNPPVADAGADFSTAICELSQICFGVSFSDSDNDLATTELLSGTGTLSGNQICFNPPTSGDYTFIIHAVDSCGLEDYDTVVVSVSINQSPVVASIAPDTLFLCQSIELCDTLQATDPDGGTLTWTHLAGAGSVTSGGIFCFTPTTSGDYSAAVAVTDSCGKADTVQINYNITLNSTPQAVNPTTPVDLFLCTSEEICYQFSATDLDMETLVWTKLSGDGTVSSTGNFCFTPTANGSYSVIAEVADGCGAADTTTISYNITINDSPTVDLGNDSTLEICQNDQICFNYTVSDPQGLTALTESMVSGYGTIDTSANQICFTPTSAGSYEFIVEVTDSCGATAIDTVLYTISFGQIANITCPAAPIDIFLCGPDTICQSIAIAPATALVSVSQGTYSGGNLCLFADTTGTYVVDIIADESCGSDTCSITFNVTIGAAAQITCPSNQTEFLCEPDTVCVPVGINGSGVTVSVSPIGYYQSGNICFVADSSGHYEIEVIAETSCGADTCIVTADVTLNSAPVAVEPTSPVDTFICSTGSICYNFSATDTEGGTLVWSRISGNGTVSSSGQWCFNATANGSYSVTAQVTDSCGLADTLSLTYDITLNSDPLISLGNDTTIFVCSTQTVCLPYSAADIDNNLLKSNLEIFGGNAVLDTVLDNFCFVESSEATYQFVLKATDDCGAEVYDTINVTLDYNSPPTVNAGSDQNLFQCAPTEICWNVSYSDPDNNIASAELINSPGTFNGSQICFTPDSSWCYEFVMKVTDECGLEAFDTVAVCVDLNQAPVADAGADQTIFQCTPTQICLPASASDPDGNLSSTVLLSGPGSYNGSDICFTPTTTGTYSFVLQATDVCGLTDLDTVDINVTINSAPICSLPNDTVISQCTQTQVCLPISATDTDGNFELCQIVSGPGSISGGQWCYTPSASQVVTVTVRCEDSCGAYCEDQFTVEFKINRDPTIAFTPMSAQFLCDTTQLCVDYSLTDPDDPQNKTVTLLSSFGTLDTANSQVCFTPDTSGIYTFIAQVTDDCGALAVDTIDVDVTLNSAPVADAGSDQSIFLCSSTQICWPASVADIDNNLINYSLDGPGTFNGSQICFTPASSGSYQFVLSGEDNCGVISYDTVTIDITMNSAPDIAFGNDTTLFLCTPVEFCFPYTKSDPDGLGGSSITLLSAIGTLDSPNNQVCFTPTTTGIYELIVQISDSCGLTDIDTITIDVTFGTSASISCPSGVFSVFQCSADSISQAISVTPATASVSPSFGTFDSGTLTFQADTAGTYEITLIASDDCGADTCVATFNVEFNTAPTVSASAGSDFAVFQCTPEVICWAASCSDTDGNLANCALTSGVGTYNGTDICFTPDTSGVYQFILTATDDCGETASDTVNVTVTLNSAPTIIAQADTSLSLCTPQEICLSYTVSDPDGLTGSTESMISGYGTINPSLDNICFTPTVDGTYEFIVEITDSCGVSDIDTVNVSVAFGQSASISCLTDTVDVFLCAADNVCQMIDIQPSSATVTTSFGTYSAGELCFYADTAGLYDITLIADESCGSDTCSVLFNVEIGSAASISCPAPQTMFSCTPDSLCIPVGVNGTSVSVSVSPIGTFQSGNICFPADTSGHYELTVIASTTCGDDTCVVEADVTINSNPIAVDPTTPIDTFICSATSICYQFSASDVDGGTLTWSRLSGPGTVSSTGQFCFNASAAGNYCVTAEVEDECGATDTVSLCYNITQNAAPILTLDNDTSITLCSTDQFCFGYSVTDIDDNLSTVQLVSGSASLDTTLQTLCFTPGTSGSYQFILQAADDCGATDLDTINVNVTITDNVTLTCPADTAIFICDDETICRPLTVSSASATVDVSPIGTYSSGQVCFTADTTGHYVLTVIVSNNCSADTCQFAVDITRNSPPVAVDPVSPVDSFICVPGDIVCPLEASDVDGGTLTWMKLSGLGTVTPDGTYTVTVSTSGSYSVEAVVYDPCGAADTVTLTYNMTINTPPTILFTAGPTPPGTSSYNATVSVCGPTELCFDYTTSDAENNITLEEFISGTATLDTTANNLCFTTDTNGTYTFIIQVTDGCGETDQDTLNVTVTNNTPPVASAGADQNLFLCQTSQVCWAASCSDIDNNLAACELITPAGSYDGSNICFTPDTSGTYLFILRAEDDCGETAFDSAYITVTLNNAPICQIPNDTTIFQCTPAEIILPVSGIDNDGNFDHCEIITGPGSIVAGEWSFTPSTDQNVKVVVMCVDQCGAECVDSFNVNIQVNDAPELDAGEDLSLFLCEPEEICLPITAFDANNNLDIVELLSSTGSFNQSTMELCFTPDTTDGKSYRFILQATDDCGAVDLDTVFVEIDYNETPDINLPPNFIVYIDYPGEVCFNVNSGDLDNNLVSVNTTSPGIYNNSTDQICFYADTSGDYCMTVTAVDDCGAQTVETICVSVEIDECIHVQIEKTHGTIQGQFETVRIFLNGAGKDLGGFDFLVAYDQSALSVGSVLPGDLFVECGWEYFTYRMGPDGNCGSACPSGLVHIVGISETNNGAYHPDCFLNRMIGDLAKINFLVTNDRLLECQYVPIKFFWYDCGDNTFSSRLGDTLWTSRDVFEYEGELVTNNSYGMPSYFGADDACMEGGGAPGKYPIRCVDFTNGGIDIICADSIDDVGDINLNNIANEIADAVLYSNYFVYGIGVFDVNIEGQIAASDVNKDGISLSVADLVYLIRIIIGDAPAYPKINPNNPPHAEFNLTPSTLSITSTTDKIGAISLTFEGEVHPKLSDNVSGMTLHYSFDGEKTRALIFDLSGQNYLESGNILELNGAKITEIEAGGYDGSVMDAKITNLPDKFELFQNYPNPFNPTTTIEFTLPVSSEYEITIYNILGQVVEKISDDADAGYIKIEWDASNFASGIYFYRLRAGEFSSTKKMVLLK